MFIAENVSLYVIDKQLTWNESESKIRDDRKTRPDSSTTALV